MKILFICKRIYTSKDLLCEKYGRLYELPKGLNASGYDLTCVCANYYKTNNTYLNDDSVYWNNFDFNRRKITGAIKYYIFLNEIVKREKPDLIIGLSDILHVLITLVLSRKYQLPYIVDLYDNFESFGLAMIPGLKSFFQYAIKNANGVSVVSPELKNYVLEKNKPNGRIVVIENAVDAKAFYPMDKASMRKKFKLPEKGVFIGTAGALSKTRGISLLFEAYLELLNNHDDVFLVLAGPVDKKSTLPKSSNILYLGELPYSEIPAFLNTLDIGVILNKDDAFGKYCFPQKYYEMLSCKLPVVASRVGVMSRVLSETPEILFDPADSKSLVTAIETQLNNQLNMNAEVFTWDNQSKKLASMVNDVMSTL